MNENFLPIIGYPAYQVSDHGHVLSLKSGCILKTELRGGGYPSVTLFRKGCGKKGHRFMVHRLVAGAFIGLIPQGMQINHKNGIKTDPYHENLEIVTASENNRHAFQVLGRPSQKGSAHGRSRLKENQVLAIRASKAAGTGQRQIAREFGVCEGTVSMIVNRRIWGHVA